MNNLIKDWKYRGLIGDYDKVYERYVETTHCDKCNVLLTKGSKGTTGKCMDHCHISGEFRNVICRSCNNKLPKQKGKIRTDNTSGHRGITFIKPKRLWKYRSRQSIYPFQKLNKSKITVLTYKFAYLILLNHKRLNDNN